MKQSNNTTISTVFFGTYTFAETILQGLLDNPLFEVSLVITQPDKPVGRKKVMTPPPVKLLAEKHGIPTQQPPTLKNFHIPRDTYHISIVAQYGLLITKDIIEAPEQGTINVHTSLLPKYRGASPIQSALLNGDEKTGITIMQMDVGMDTGPILLQREIDILPDETYLELDARMAKLGVEALHEAIPPYLSGELKPHAQDDTQATLCKKLSRDDGKVDWNKTTQDVYNQYRALTPWPGVWTMFQDKRLKLLKLKPATTPVAPGTFSVSDDHLFIGTADASIEILELQLEGKAAMHAETFINGYRSYIQ